MSGKLRITGLIFAMLFLLSPIFQSPAFAASVETPKGKKIPGRIVDEGDDDYKMETELPGGGKIIFNIDKEKVDPHGTVPGAGRIEEIEGTAEIKKVGRTYYSKARKGMAVQPGDEIRTGLQSKVVITLEKTAINGVGANSRFVLESIEKNPDTKFVDIKVSLPKGELWSEVGRLKTKESQFRVATPTAVTGVRGTVFHVEVAEGTEATNISVLSGKVGVISSAIPAKEVVLGKSVLGPDEIHHKAVGRLHGEVPKLSLPFHGDDDFGPLRGWLNAQPCDRTSHRHQETGQKGKERGHEEPP